jgi:hypothetical protein
MSRQRQKQPKNKALAASLRTGWSGGTKTWETRPIRNKSTPAWQESASRRRARIAVDLWTVCPDPL